MAISAIAQQKIPLLRASKMFKVPRGTLQDRIKKRYKKKGKSTALTSAEETEISDWILYISSVGFPITKKLLMDSVQMYVNKSKKQTKFRNNRPGRDWFNRFLLRHPNIAKRRAETLSKYRAEITENGLRNWFAEVNLKIV